MAEVLTYDLSIRRGDSERLSVILEFEDIFTGERTIPDLSFGAFVTWAFAVPDDPIMLTTKADGGLEWDSATGEVARVLTPDQTAAWQAAPVPFVLKFQDEDGAVRTYLTGNVSAEG